MTSPSGSAAGPGTVEVRRVGFADVRVFREAYRQAARCQIVRDSILERGLADAFLLYRNGQVAGYGGVWNAHFPGRVMEFFLLVDHRPHLGDLFPAFVGASGATHLEAQSNLPAMDALLDRFAGQVRDENFLFGEGSGTEFTYPGAVVRPRQPTDEGPDGEWVVELDGRAVAAGGVLTHYNPPFGDLYLEVIPELRSRGLGSWFVQELRRICREAGLTPAARCDTGNVASRRALERGGLVRCGSLRTGVLGGRVSPSPSAP